MHRPWYLIENTRDLLSPAMVVYPERIIKNIETMLAMVGGDTQQLRPHVKTHKISEIVQLQLEYGIRKFKCATIAEAEMIGINGADDVLLAYQPVGPNQKRVLALQQKYPATRFSALVDDLNIAKELNQLFKSADTSLPVYLDLDVGYHRTGIAAGTAALDIVRYCCASEGLDLRGLHIYDGHVLDEDPAQRKAVSDQLFLGLNDFIESVQKLAGREVERIAGGSPTFAIHAQREGVECSPGTCVLWDWGYSSKYTDLPFVHAALVVSRIISKPGANMLCLDLGHKAIAADKPVPRVYFYNLPADAKQLTHSEEHLLVEVADNTPYKIGEVIYGVPIHICPTSPLHREVAVVWDHRITEYWKVTARDRKLSI